jgi:hypothetical protein
MSDETNAAAKGVTHDLRAAAVSLATTEIFALQGARSSTISESTGRASMFLSAVSGGLVALGLVATATHVGTAFYAFGLVLLPTLTFIGLVTFERVLQTGIEDHDYARRISRLRAFNFDAAPELAAYMPRVTLQDRVSARGLSGGRRLGYRTVAGMVAVITSVLAGSTIAVLVAVISSHWLAASLATGALVAIGIVLALMEYQRLAWLRYEAESGEINDPPAPRSTNNRLDEE